ncbi:MAG: tRNA lysidine(34) synthetase TilS [Thiolinea sp.]
MRSPVHWEGCEVRRYRDDVYALAPLTVQPTGQRIPWPDPAQDMQLPDGQVLTAAWLAAVLDYWQERGVIARAAAAQSGIEIRYRQGGEVLQRGQYTINLKQCLQERGVPPWQRARLPLLYVGEQLLAIAGLDDSLKTHTKDQHET